MAETKTETVAVVLSGAGARGAFQAGALAELVPWLVDQGLRPSIWLGTSAGSINATLWGAAAHLDADEAAQQILDLWTSMGDEDVYAPLFPTSGPRTALQYAAGAVLGVGPGTTSLLDTTPLRRTAHQRLPTRQLATNVADGAVGAVGVVATRMPSKADLAGPGSASGRSVLFLDEHRQSGYAGEPDRGLEVARGPVDADHVLASSAIPAAFPPIRVDQPTDWAGWYLDGGVRLNTPLHPAVGLGADRIVVVSAAATDYGPTPLPDQRAGSPDIADAAAQVLNAVLGDDMIEDLRNLRRTNRLVQQAAEADVRLTRNGARGNAGAYRVIEHLAVSPPPGAMGAMADDLYRARTQGLRRLTEMDNWLLGKAIRGAGDAVGRRELLSYLFFDQEYFAAGAELGRRTAREAIGQGWGL